MWNRASANLRTSVACLALVLTLLACGGGGGGGNDTGGGGSDDGGGSGGITTSRPTGPILFLSDMPGICNGGNAGYSCQRPCSGTPNAEGFNVGNAGDQALAWLATILPSSLRLSVTSGVVPPHSRVGQHVDVIPKNNASYHIRVTAVGRTVPIDVMCG